MKEYQDKTSGTVTLSFLDVTGALAAPTTATYQIDCLTTGTNVRTLTTLTAASQITFILSTSDNAIINPINQSEIKKITVNATYGAGDEAHAETHYVVRNMRFV